MSGAEEFVAVCLDTLFDDCRKMEILKHRSLPCVDAHPKPGVPCVIFSRPSQIFLLIRRVDIP